MSVGDVTTGHLVAGVRLTEDAALGILPHQRRREYLWGTNELIGALQFAARELYRQTGTRLWVGHLSKQHGGDLPYSVSHNSGRDADIAFAYREADGSPLDPDDFITVFSKGHTARRGVEFDPVRTWLLVKALISYPDAQIQYLFLSRPLEGRLLQHAKARGEPKSVRQRAAALLHQPGRGAADHDDHIHLRLYCSKDDVLAGCRNTGRKLPFAKLHRRARARFAVELAQHLSSDDAELRRRALDRLGLLQAKLLGLEVVVRLGDPSPEVQRAAAVALARFGEGVHMAAVRRWMVTLDAAGRLAAAQELARCREPGAGELLAHLIDQATTELPEVIEVAGSSRHLACVPPLVRRLDHDEGAVRQRAARALGRLTAHRYVADWGRLTAGSLAAQQQRWRHAWAAGHSLSRRRWLMRGFLRAGFEVGRIEPVDAWSLVSALDGPDHIARNAAEQLAELFGRRGDCHFWVQWLGSRREAFDLAPPPRLCR